MEVGVTNESEKDMTFKFTESEIKALETCPEALRLVANWRDCQQDQADAMDFETTGDGKRANELRAEADRIEATY